MGLKDHLKEMVCIIILLIGSIVGCYILKNPVIYITCDLLIIIKFFNLLFFEKVRNIYAL